MTQKKLLWILIPLSVLAGGFLALTVVTPRVVEFFNVLQLETDIQNAKFRMDRLKEIQELLDTAEIESARELTNRMYKLDIQLLEMIQDGESECGGFSAAGHGAGQDVSAGQTDGYGVFLDRCRYDESQVFQGAPEGRLKRKGIEGHLSGTP